MQSIPECPICGAPTFDRWCQDCRERMERAYEDAEAERLATLRDTLPTVEVAHDVF